MYVCMPVRHLHWRVKTTRQRGQASVETLSSSISVTIDREYSIIEDQLDVRVLGPDGETRYSVIVDITAEEIVDVIVFAGEETGY